MAVGDQTQDHSCSHRTIAEWSALTDDRDRLRAENEELRKAFCDEAYILMVQALDVKALPKGRKRILTEQAIRMARVGLNEGRPRHTSYRPSTLCDRARDVITALASDGQERTHGQ